MTSHLYTIGYEGKDSALFFQQLKAAGVQLLLDIRIRANSRKRDFSKTKLAALCVQHGIKYEHEVRLGTPEYIMKQLKDTGVYNWDEYKKHLHSDEEPLIHAAELATKQPTCLLCYEAIAKDCHRRIVANEIATRTGLEVTDL